MGPTGTGKTLTVSDKLLKGMDNKYLSNFLTFSARTSANQSQDIIDGKLDKRWTCHSNLYNAFPVLWGIGLQSLSHLIS